MRAFLLGFTILAGLAVIGPIQEAQESGQIEQAPANDSDWYLRVARPGRPIYMALPTFDLRGSDAKQAADTLSDVVWKDLEYASLYRLVPKRLYSIIAGEVTPGTIDYYQWESIGTDILGRRDRRDPARSFSIGSAALRGSGATTGVRQTLRRPSLRGSHDGPPDLR